MKSLFDDRSITAQEFDEVQARPAFIVAKRVGVGVSAVDISRKPRPAGHEMPDGLALERDPRT